MFGLNLYLYLFNVFEISIFFAHQGYIYLIILHYLYFILKYSESSNIVQSFYNLK